MFWTILRGHFYRPQTKFAKVMFLLLSVSHSVHGGGGVCPSACWDTPPDQRQTPPGATPPPGADTPLHSACWEIREQAGGMHPTGMHTCQIFGGRQSLYK